MNLSATVLGFNALIDLQFFTQESLGEIPVLGVNNVFYQSR